MDRSCCPLSCGLDLLGDKWSLLIIRDLFLGRERFKDFLDSPEGIPTNILANRLEKLEAEKIIERRPVRKGVKRYTYHLTEKGRDLKKVLTPLSRWALKHIPGTEIRMKKAE